jgi:hypothetical protein
MTPGSSVLAFIFMAVYAAAALGVTAVLSGGITAAEFERIMNTEAVQE